MSDTGPQRVLRALESLMRRVRFLVEVGIAFLLLIDISLVIQFCERRWPPDSVITNLVDLGDGTATFQIHHFTTPEIFFSRLDWDSPLSIRP